MGAARQRKIRGETDDLRYIAWPHDARLLVLSILRGVAARTRDAKRSLWKAISATAYEEDEAGGLMSYTADYSDLVRRGAIYVDKILRGAKPSELPVEQASKFEFVLNMRTAKALGLTIPPSIMIQVTELIE